MRARYGASPVHLLAHLILLPLIGWALLTGALFVVSGALYLLRIRRT